MNYLSIELLEIIMSYLVNDIKLKLNESNCILSELVYSIHYENINQLKIL